MRTHFNRLVSEATLYAQDNGEDFATTGHQTLATIARKPEVIAAVNRAREVASKDRWRELCVGLCPPQPTPAERDAANAVWAVMPGYTCWNDAANICARL